MNIFELLGTLGEMSGIAMLFDAPLQLVMILISFVLLYLALVKGFEPLLLVGIAFGMLLTNLPGGAVFHPELWDPARYGGISAGEVFRYGGLLDFFYFGLHIGLYPSLIFLGVGAMTDFSPMLANRKTMFFGLAAQMGIFAAFLLALRFGFNGAEGAAIGIIGSADGPTALFLTSRLAPELLGAVAVAAYSYMALVPLIQPPFMRLLTTKKERAVVMPQARTVSKQEKIVFPIAVSAFVILLLPAVAPLVGMLMLGNLLKECGLTDRLSDTAQNALMNIVTIFLSLSVGATTVASSFLTRDTIIIVVLGLLAFSLSTVSGVLMGKLMYVVTGGKVNPLIGSAGVSAIPMSARVCQMEGQRANPKNFLLMHAMGGSVSSVVCSALVAGFFLVIFGG